MDAAKQQRVPSNACPAPCSSTCTESPLQLRAGPAHSGRLTGLRTRAHRTHLPSRVSVACSCSWLNSTLAMSGWRAAGAAWAGDALGGVARQRRDAGSAGLARRPAETRPWSCMGDVVVLRCVQGVTGRDSGRARQKEGKYCELERLGARSKPRRDGQSRAGRWLSCQRNSWVGMKLV